MSRLTGGSYYPLPQHPFSDSFCTEFSEVPQPTWCPGAHTFPSDRSMVYSLRGTRTSRERARPLPALLLDQGSLPDRLPAARQERLAGSSAREGVRDMFTKLTDTNKAAIFSVLVLLMSVGAALLIRFLELTPGYVMFSIWSFTPTVAALIMLLVVTREGYSREGWKSLGLHRFGLNVWWIAFGVTLLITVAASAIVWATPLASFTMPEGGLINA